MRKLFALLFVLLLAQVASAAPLNIVGTLTTVSNTTAYSSTNVTFNYVPYMQKFIVQHGTLTNTNSLVINFQQSADQINFVTTYTWRPSSTNDAYETISASTIPVTNYFRLQIVTTNLVQVNTTYGD